MTLNRSPEISLSVLKSSMCYRLLAMFQIIVEKHIKCIKVDDLYKIVRSAISHAPWYPCLSSQIDVWLFGFYLSQGLVRVCEINRIHHWCSVGTEKSQPEVPPFSGKRGLPSFPLNGGPEGWDFSGTTEHQ